MSRKRKSIMRPHSSIHSHTERKLTPLTAVWAAQGPPDNTPDTQSTPMLATGTQVPPVKSYPDVPYHVQRLFFHLENAITRLGDYMTTKIDAVYDRTESQLKAFEDRISERLSAIEKVNQEHRFSGRDDRTCYGRLDSEDSVVRCARAAQTAPLYGCNTPPTMISTELELGDEYGDGKTGRQDVIILDSDKLHNSVTELAQSMDTLNRTLVTNSSTRIMDAIIALEDTLTTRSNHTDGLLAQLAKAVNSTRDEAYNEKEELTTLLRDTYFSQIAKMKDLSNELLKIKTFSGANSIGYSDKSDCITNTSDFGELRGRSHSFSTTPSNCQKTHTDTGIMTDLTNFVDKDYELEFDTSVDGTDLKPQSRKPNLTVMTEVDSSPNDDVEQMFSSSETTFVDESSPRSQEVEKTPEEVQIERLGVDLSLPQTPTESEHESATEITISVGVMDELEYPTTPMNEQDESEILNIIDGGDTATPIDDNATFSFRFEDIEGEKDTTLEDIHVQSILAKVPVVEPTMGISPSLLYAKIPECPRSLSPLTSIYSSDEEPTALTECHEADIDEQVSNEQIAKPQPKELLFACPNGCGKKFACKKYVQKHLRRNSCGFNKKRKAGERDQLAPGPSSIPRKKTKVIHVTSKTFTASLNNGASGTSKGSDSSPLWPTKTHVGDVFGRQMIQCDRCDSYYHYRCVGIKNGDRRLKEGVQFICQPCKIAKGKCSDTPCDICTRPDCDWLGEKEDTDYFTIEKVVGRAITQSVDTKGKNHYTIWWLVKWHGYDYPDCTWTSYKELPNASSLIQKFIVEYARQSRSNCQSAVFLDEVQLTVAIAEKWEWTKLCDLSSS